MRSAFVSLLLAFATIVHANSTIISSRQIDSYKIDQGVFWINDDNLTCHPGICIDGCPDFPSMPPVAEIRFDISFFARLPHNIWLRIIDTNSDADGSILCGRVDELLSRSDNGEEYYDLNGYLYENIVSTYDGSCERQLSELIELQIGGLEFKSSESIRLESVECPAANQAMANFDITKIFGLTFYFSFEEGSADGSVFRPSGFHFPPSYPRPGFKFDSDGKYTDFQPAPNDAGHVQTVGSWSQVGPDIFRIQITGQPAETIKLQGSPARLKRWILDE